MKELKILTKSAPPIAFQAQENRMAALVPIANFPLLPSTTLLATTSTKVHSDIAAYSSAKYLAASSSFAFNSKAF